MQTKFIHLFNAGAWLVNAALWGFYAKNVFMGLTSLGAVFLSIKLAQWENDR